MSTVIGRRGAVKRRRRQTLRSRGVRLHCAALDVPVVVIVDASTARSTTTATPKSDETRAVVSTCYKD